MCRKRIRNAGQDRKNAEEKGKREKMFKLKMKKNVRTIAALVLAAAVAAGPLCGVTAYAGTLGNQFLEKKIQTTWSTELTKGVFYSTALKDQITENFVAYSPGGNVKPVIAYGNDIYGAASFKTVVSYAEAAGQHVVAGINADYFTMANGVADSIVIQDGIIKTSESSKNTAIGFRADGSAFIGRANLKVRVLSDRFPEGINGIHMNKAVTDASGIVMYTDAYNSTNKAAIPTINVLVDITEGAPQINQTMSGVVESVQEAAGATAIPDGKVLLSLSANSSYSSTMALFKTIQPGDAISFSFEADHSWDDVVSAVGAGEKLLTKGVNVAPSTGGRQPRTALGIKPDGTVILYTVDGRQTGYSAGVTFREEAGRMLELGCTEAVNLDGGGSTALLARYPGNTEIDTINKPSGGVLRNCGNYILLVSEGGATGTLGGLHLYPYSQYLLAGARQTFTVKATDTNYYPTAVPGDLTYSADSMGTIDADGVYTAGHTAGDGTVSVSGGGAYGSVNVKIVTNPDSIQITNASTGEVITGAISVTTGKTFRFSGKAKKNNVDLTAQAQCFNWNVTGNVGTIDQNGVFTPNASGSGSGTVTASAGGKTASVQVNLTSRGEQVENFEGSALKFSTGTHAGVTASVESADLLLIHNGKKSLKLDYDASKVDGSITVTVPAQAAFTESPSMLSFWLYGDGSGNTLMFIVDTESGRAVTDSLKIDFSGWKQLSVDLPEGTTGIAGLNIGAIAKEAGTIYVDQIMAGFGHFSDNQPPAVTVSVSGQTLSATVSDAVDTNLSKNQIRVTYDGVSRDFTYDASTKKLTAQLPAADGKLHRAAVIAEDASGNIRRAAVTAGTAVATPFKDMDGHWALSATSYLHSQNIISGRTQPDGSSMYFPNLNMTRAEFASVMVKWLKINTAQYENTVLPFSDSSLIPDWALPAVKAAYARGLMSGRGTADGKVNFSPNGPITRQEVMTVIGHTQERGYEEANLAAQFSDSSAVASWALPYVRTLVAQGAVSGSNGKIMPGDYVTRAQVASIIFGLN